MNPLTTMCKTREPWHLIAMAACRYPWRFTITLASLVIAKVVNLGVPMTLKAIVDHLDQASPALTVPVSIVMAYAMLRFAVTMFAQLREFVFERVLRDSMRHIVTEVFRHLRELGLRYHLNRETGAIIRDVERGKSGIYNVLGYAIFHIAPTIVEITLVAGLLLAKFPPIYALVVMATMVLYAALTFWLTERRARLVRTAHDVDAVASARALDGLFAIETVKHFGGEASEAATHERDMARVDKLALKAEASRSILNLGQSLVATAGLAALLWRAAADVAAGRMTLGDLVLVNSLLVQVIAPLNFLSTAYREIRQGIIDMERMNALLREPIDVVDAVGAPPIEIKAGVVRFDDVTFGYDAKRPIVRGISFELSPGRVLAIVGMTGSGKTTLVRLLARLFDVDAGRITIDGTDIRSVAQRSLRMHIGYVPQDPVLFNDTIRQNIAYGVPDAAEERIHRAASIACIHNTILALPDGYDTLVGERGLKLSGGERQRLAIARAVLLEPPILVLDEVTSAVDLSTEATIRQQLHAYGRERATLVIAHRVAMIAHADEIMVLSQGVVAERGTHAELMAAGRVYAQLWHDQKNSDCLSMQRNCVALRCMKNDRHSS